MLRKGDPWHDSGWNFTHFWTWWAQMMHKHSQEMSEAFFAGCCQARQFKGHAPTSTHGELQKNPNKLAELDRLGAARSWSDGTWWAPKGPKRPWNDGWLERALFFPLGNKIGNGIGLGELQKGPSFFFQKDPGMTKVEQYGERPFWLNAMRHWASFKSNTQTRKREWRAWL